jgi:superfamily II DNA helicase RecQ
MHGEKTVRLDFPETTTAAEPRKKKRSKSRQSLSWIAPLEELLNDTGENVSGTDNAADNSGADALFEELRLLRKKLAAEAQVPPYCVLHDSVMRELAQTMPSTIDEAAKIKGVGPGKMETVIPAFIDAIRKWKKTNGDG